jgi:hypothetical protein
VIFNRFGRQMLRCQTLLTHSSHNEAFSTCQSATESLPDPDVAAPDMDELATITR